ncbi:MAG: redox-regulated ATPase YchF [Thermoleophilia bacterium]|nr:redox-regulated ATPase YchF [Thermoleophilia bacterium]
MGCMKIGIVGLPNVGKSTLFNALTKAGALAANYPFATIEPNVGVVPVTDPRLDQLAAVYATEARTPKVIPSAVTFVDIAGLVKGASEGQGMGNKFLATIRECDAIVQVVRAFTDENVTHVEGRVDPNEDIETINTELAIADLESVDKRLYKVKKDSSQKHVVASLEAARAVLDEGRLLSSSGLDLEPIRDLFLLTAKPFIYVFNIDEDALSDLELRAKLSASVAPSDAIFVCASVEAELSDLEPEEAAELLAGLGQDESGLNALVHAAQHTLGLQTYLTAGEKEIRAWTIPIGATAPQAAGVIHTDFERGFIKAEIVGFHDLIEVGSVPAARAVGKARLEGKDYIMQPDDVVDFRFNV